MELVIDCKSDGTVESMYCDKFQLGFLGKQSISRASEIAFNTETQLWDIHVLSEQGEATHELASHFRSYEEARDIEVAWFNAARLAGVNPLSPRGLKQLKLTILYKFFPNI